MDLALLLFGLLWAWGRGAGGAGGGSRGGGGSAPATPVGPVAPWPQVVPSGLPPFPGRGWEYDEPPPRPVQERARQLLSDLWARGQGSYRVDQTAGRWIIYRAEITRGDKRGVVAYREARRALPTSPATPELNAQARTQTSAARAAAVPPAPRPMNVSTPSVAPSALQLPTLRVGVGMPPRQPVPDVRLLQQKLGIDSDGRFGPGTLTAVKEFQRRRGLEPDGVVGPLTWTALFAVRA